jgi:two-component system, cell cycle sensor histidine kinase and response regulator CckA
MVNTQILVVEDESIIAEDIQDGLKRLGYAVSAVAYSGEEAIRKAGETRPDLVLMDIVLKGDMDGVEAAKEIRARFNIPVVYLTAYSDDGTFQRAKITEPNGYILKPFEGRELRTTIEMALYKHKMERRLKESEQWLATTLRSIGDAVIATDKRGVITFMNPVAERLTGWNQKDALGKDLREVFNIIDEQTHAPAENPGTKVLQEGVVSGLIDHVLISKDGGETTIDDSAAPIKDDKGNVTGVVLVFRDTTERKRVEEELLKARKLESIGVLAGGIAHDFNNLLTSILGNISLIKMYPNSGDKMHRRLAEAEKACLRAKDLTQQLLTFSKGGAPVKRVSFIGELIKDSASFALMGSNVKCEFSISEDLWPVEVDERQIYQVISNVVINADQAMPEGGIIKIIGQNINGGGEEPTVHTHYEGNAPPLPLKRGRYIQITVEDQGIGVPKEYLTKIFDPYFTTKQKGSGLGLATAYSIIKGHDGYIGVESELGVGMKVHIYIPALDKGVEQRGAEVEAEGIVYGKGRILIMDDEAMIREVIGDMLSHIGYEVEYASDGEEAIEKYIRARGSKRPFDIIVMDLTIPGGMGGKEAISKLMGIDPEVRAVVSSGYSNDLVMSEYRNHGFRGVISKPYSIEKLAEILNKVMNEE